MRSLPLRPYRRSDSTPFFFLRSPPPTSLARFSLFQTVVQVFSAVGSSRLRSPRDRFSWLFLPSLAQLTTFDPAAVPVLLLPPLVSGGSICTEDHARTLYPLTL